ncbi:MAG: hypothetical protein FJX42_12580 [Alphaproteobacteria bacterium]|nr:hypothetical protein [Alphaproteobacteria bacterium]
MTGNYLRGPSVAACLAVAHETAARVDRFLGEAGSVRRTGPSRGDAGARILGRHGADGGSW